MHLSRILTSRILTVTSAVALAWLLPIAKLKAEEVTGKAFIGDDALWGQLAKGDVALLPTPEDDQKEDEDSKHSLCAALLIDAPVKAVWDVIADKEAGPSYVASLKSAKVVERTEEFILIEQVMKIGPLPQVTYIVKHEPDPFHAVNFKLHSGEMKAIDGFWKFFPVDEGKKCLLVYRLSLQPNFPVPNFVIRNALKSSLPNALLGVKAQVDQPASD